VDLKTMDGSIGCGRRQHPLYTHHQAWPGAIVARWPSQIHLPGMQKRRAWIGTKVLMLLEQVHVT